MTESNQLEERVARLEAQLTQVTAELAALRDAVFIPGAETATASSHPIGQAGDTEELLSMVEHSHILTRLAATSFILVVALALRELPKSGVLDVQLGTLLGMVYAFGLLAYSWLAYSQKNHQAPVFALWGTVVMCSVVVETHRIFEALPTIVAYLLLVALGLGTLLMSRRYRAALPVFAGTIGMSIGSFAINYPQPVFPLQAVILILANVFAAYASGLLRASWLRWFILALTVLTMQFWVFKLATYLERHPGVVPDWTLQGLLPALVLIGLVLAAIALAGVLGKIQEQVAKFDRLLPFVNVLWLFATLHYAVTSELAAAVPTGILAALGGAGHLTVAGWLYRRGGATAAGTSTFTLAGSALIALALPLALGHALAASALIAGLALALAMTSHRIGSGGMRLVSYLLQFYASASLIVLLWTTEKTEPSLLGAGASAVLAVIGAYHYLWSRRTPPPVGEPWTDRLNPQDRWAALLLVAAVLCGFFTLRMGLYQGLMLAQAASEQAFIAGQSLIINLAAVVLLLASLRKRNTEVRNVGALITVIAVGKLLLDTVDLKGYPLLISLFSFGVAATVASVVLGRWGKGPQEAVSKVHPSNAGD